MSKTKELTEMSKDRLMTYTFVALLVLVGISFLSFGLTSIIAAAIAVLVAVGIDLLISKMAEDAEQNTMSAAVFGLIVALSYSLGLPAMRSYEALPLVAPDAYFFVAAISAVGETVFKKLPVRKYFNPAAAAKFIVLIPFLDQILLAKDHLVDGMLGVPSLAGPIGYEILGNNGFDSFAGYIVTCFSDPTATITTTITQSDILQLLLVQKWHGWAGGVSSIAVIAVGIALFVIARRYIKWRITLSYLLTVAVLALALGFIFGDSDPILRVLFHLFIGSSIFLAFFMATDPATTPITYLGQLIFGVGLALLTILIQVFMGFFGGSLLALLIMNLTSPFLDKVGILKYKKGKNDPKLPKTKQYTSVKEYPCIRCGACMRICVNRLSPILIKEAFEKQNIKKLMKLNADYCAGCDNCNLVCPSRIDLESFTLNYPMTSEEVENIEQYFLKGEKDENNGVYTKIMSAKSSVEGQDGGVATAILMSGMERGLFDAAIVVQRTEGYWAEAVVAENTDEIMKAKGTKYLRANMMYKIGELVAQGKRKIAIVGQACEIRAARRIQQMLVNEVSDLELTMIGLFCFECFDYEKLKEETKRLLDIDLDRAEKTQIKKGKYTVQIGEQEKSISVKELHEAVEKGCLNCPDFTAKYSDISVGSVGSEAGFSTVLVRSDIGEKLLEKLDFKEGKVEKKEITKLSVLKKKRADSNK